jgi:hypothetical protein
VISQSEQLTPGGQSWNRLISKFIWWDIASAVAVEYAFVTRKARRWLILLALSIPVGVACFGFYGWWPGGGIPTEVHEVLAHSEEWELYSLFPDENESRLPERFQGYGVLGKTTVRDPGTRKVLLDALENGAPRYYQWLPGDACFSPRHGIHATYRGKSVDLAICFECSHVYQDKVWQFRTTKAPQPVFDAVLSDAGIALAPAGPPPVTVPK